MVSIGISEGLRFLPPAGGARNDALWDGRLLCGSLYGEQISEQRISEGILLSLFLVFEAIGDEDAFEVIDFVLDDDGKESGGAFFYFFSVFIFVANGDAFGTFNEEVFFRETQAAFFEEDFFSGVGGDFRIDEHGSLAVDFDDGESEGMPDLWRGKPDAFGDAEGVKHDRDEFLDVGRERIFHAFGFSVKHLRVSAGDNRENVCHRMKVVWFTLA